MSISKQNKNTYTAAVYSSKLPFPLAAAVHTYFVVSKNNTHIRYDVINPKHFTHKKPTIGSIYKNFLEPEQGFTLFYFRKPIFLLLRWNVKCIYHYEGDEESLAHRMYSFFESNSHEKYPYVDFYRKVMGPNSNSFSQWVIDQIPGLHIKLPWNAWGKGYQR